MKALFFAALVMGIGCGASVFAADLQVRIEGIQATQGTVMIDLHNDPAAFPRDAAHAFRRASFPVDGKEGLFTFRDVPPGIYAYTYLVDENGDGKLDTKILGIPSEGIGFSKNPSFTLSAPSFQDAAFEVKEPGSVAESTVKYY